ncbi:MAG: universal stress protein [Bacteroidetes bacterium]|nr:universal stress protein [Bacteroidota bacterium]
MEKRFLLVIDGNHYSDSVIDYGIYLARMSGSQIEGIFLRDLRNTQYIYPILFDQPFVDTTVYTDLMDIERANITKSIQKFRDRCDKEKIPFKVHFDEQRPLESIIARSAVADIIIIDGATDISDIFPDTPSSSLRELLVDAMCPILIVPRESHPIDDIILTSDGSYSSVYAIKMFGYLFPELHGLKATVLSIEHASSHSQVSHDPAIADMIKRKFDNVSYHIEYGKATDQLKAYMSDHGSNTMVVMGAYGRNAVSRLWHQSLANGLIKDAKVPVFISHT